MRLVVCHDHRLLLEALVHALARNGFVIEAATSSPTEAVAAVRMYDPDLLVTSLVFHCGEEGLDAARAVQRSHGHTKVLILTSTDDPGALLEAIRLGVAGYLRTDLDLTNIVATLRRIEAGNTQVDPGLLRRLSARAAGSEKRRSTLDTLTRQERIVLDCLVEGMRTSEIVEALGISKSTVRSHVQSVLLKLGVHSRLQAVAVVNSGTHEEVALA